MSESSIPIERSSASTRRPPALVEPPSQTSSWLAAASSETSSIFRSTLFTYEPGTGTPSCRSSTAIAIASLSVEAAGKRARAFQAAPAPVARFWTYTAHVPGYARLSERIRPARNGSSSDARTCGRDAHGRP